MSKFIHVSHNSSTCNKHPEIPTYEMLNPLVKKILFHCEKGENKIQFEKVSKDSTPQFKSALYKKFCVNLSTWQAIWKFCLKVIVTCRTMKKIILNRFKLAITGVQIIFAFWPKHCAKLNLRPPILVC